LAYLKISNRAGIEIDALLEGSAQAAAVEGDDPALLDDHLFDHPAIVEGGAADGSIFALWNAASDKELAPLFGEHLGQAIARRMFGVHYSAVQV
jgi:hypothetical protein